MKNHLTYEFLQAAANGHTENIAILIDDGIDVNAKDNEGMTWLMSAASNGRKETVAMLINKDADVNYVKKSKRGKQCPIDLRLEDFKTEIDGDLKDTIYKIRKKLGWYDNLPTGLK